MSTQTDVNKVLRLAAELQVSRRALLDAVTKFDPDQPRDEGGRFAGGSGGGGSGGGGSGGGSGESQQDDDASSSPTERAMEVVSAGDRAEKQMFDTSLQINRSFDRIFDHMSAAEEAETPSKHAAAIKRADKSIDKAEGQLGKLKTTFDSLTAIHSSAVKIKEETNDAKVRKAMQFAAKHVKEQVTGGKAMVSELTAELKQLKSDLVPLRKFRKE